MHSLVLVVPWGEGYRVFLLLCNRDTSVSCSVEGQWWQLPTGEVWTLGSGSSAPVAECELPAQPGTAALERVGVGGEQRVRVWAAGMMDGMGVIPFRHSEPGVCAGVMWNLPAAEGPIIPRVRNAGPGVQRGERSGGAFWEQKVFLSWTLTPPLKQLGPLQAQKGKMDKNSWFYLHNNTKTKIHNSTCARQTWAVAPLSKDSGNVCIPEPAGFSPACLYLQGGIQDKEPHSAQQEVLQPPPSAWGYLIFLKMANFPSQSLGGTVSIHWIISDIFSSIYWCFSLHSQSLSALTRAR